MFEDLLPGQCFSVTPEPGADVFMRMLTGEDAVQLVGEDPGRVFEFPGHAVYIRPLVTIDNRDDEDTELWSEDYGMFDAEDGTVPMGWSSLDLDEENERLLASMMG